MDRRSFLKLSAAAAGTAFLTGVLESGAGMRALAAETGGRKMSRNILTVYFSKTGNTKAIADEILARAGGAQFRAETVEPYPEDYRQTTQKARAELDNNMRPAIVGSVDVESCDTVFIGYPNWWGTLPMALFTFLEAHDLTGKTVIPFCTHEGSGLGRGPADIRRLCSGAAAVLDGLAVRGSAAGRSQSDVAAWLGRIGVTG